MDIDVYKVRFRSLLGLQPVLPSASAGEEPELQGNGNSKRFYIQSNSKSYHKGGACVNLNT